MSERPEPAYTIAGARDLEIDVDDGGRVVLCQLPVGAPEGAPQRERITIPPGSLAKLGHLFLALHEEWEQQALYRPLAKG